MKCFGSTRKTWCNGNGTTRRLTSWAPTRWRAQKLYYRTGSRRGLRVRLTSREGRHPWRACRLSSSHPLTLSSSSSSSPVRYAIDKCETRFSRRFKVKTSNRLTFSRSTLPTLPLHSLCWITMSRACLRIEPRWQTTPAKSFSHTTPIYSTRRCSLWNDHLKEQLIDKTKKSCKTKFWSATTLLREPLPDQMDLKT